jgi:uncharacterized protein with von Willebrand factor type A (vWA) domain
MTTAAVRTAPGSTDLATLATAFSRALRAVGLDAPPSSTIGFADALCLLGPTSGAHVFVAGQACFCRGPEDLEPYSDTFAAFFGRALPTPRSGRLMTAPPGLLSPKALAWAAGDGEDASGVDEDDMSGPAKVLVAYSALEVLRSKDFAVCSEAELDEIGRLVGQLRRRPPMRRGRRLVPTSRHGRGAPDVRRTVRSAMRSGGEAASIERRRPSPRPRRVVLLLDVSGSMRPYTRALLRFAHATAIAQRQVEAFTLSTRCTRVTRELGWRDPDAALRRATEAAPDLEGGTRLGTGLRTFNDHWGVAGVARGAVCVLCSDGWDRGDPTELATEMQRLSRVAHRVVWVNPLKATEGYEPLARGMAAALPYVDEFVAGNSLLALEELAQVISR